MQQKRPGGELAKRPLHFIWIVDCSGSMELNSRIQQVNFAIREALPAMREVANENPNAQVLMRAISFSDGAKWHIENKTPVENFQWVDLSAKGVTDMGKAMRLVTEEMKIPPMEDRALPPVLVLVTDGQPTDNFQAGLDELMALPWGQKAVRLGIAIGEDADNDTLKQFIGNNEIAPLNAKNAEQLVTYIRWASTVVLKAASAPKSQDIASGKPISNIPLPPPPSMPANFDPTKDVF